MMITLKDLDLTKEELESISESIEDAILYSYGVESQHIGKVKAFQQEEIRERFQVCIRLIRDRFLSGMDLVDILKILKASLIQEIYKEVDNGEGTDSEDEDL